MRIVRDFFRLYLFLLNLTFNIVFDKRRQYIILIQDKYGPVSGENKRLCKFD
jgi:hypothetical protein